MITKEMMEAAIKEIIANKDLEPEDIIPPESLSGDNFRLLLETSLNVAVHTMDPVTAFGGIFVYGVIVGRQLAAMEAIESAFSDK